MNTNRNLKYYSCFIGAKTSPTYENPRGFYIPFLFTKLGA